MSNLPEYHTDIHHTNKILPKRIENLFDMKNHSYNTRQGNSPKIPIHGTQKYNNSFICKSSSYWLTLPHNVKDKPSCESFIAQLKKHIITNPNR